MQPRLERAGTHLRDVLGDRLREHQALPSAVGRDEADPSAGGCVAERGSPFAVGKLTLPAEAVRMPKSAPEEVRTPRALDAGEPDDLARVRLEADILEARPDRELRSLAAASSRSTSVAAPAARRVERALVPARASRARIGHRQLGARRVNTWRRCA